MIFGATERVTGRVQPNFQTDRVVKVSSSGPTPSPVVKLKPKTKWSYDPIFGNVKAPKIKTDASKPTPKSASQTEMGDQVSEILALPVTKKKVIPNVVKLKTKSKWDPLAAKNDDVILKVQRKKKKNTESKDSSVLNFEDYAGEVTKLGDKLGLTDKPKSKTKKIKTKKSTIDLDLTSAKVRDLSLKGLSNDEELNFLQQQLERKLKAVAQEEGLEDSVFDVQAALAPFREGNPPTIKERLKSAKQRLQARKSRANFDFESLATEGSKFAKVKPKTTQKLSAEEVDDRTERLRKRSRTRLVADSKLNTRYVKVVPDDPKDKMDARVLATNAVDIPKATVVKMRNRVKDLTKSYTNFLRNEIVPHIIAFDSAMDYVGVILRDGLGRDDVGSDNKLHTSLQWLLHSRMMDFFSETLKMKKSRVHFDKVFAEMMQQDLGSSKNYESNIVGMIRAKTASTAATGVKTSRSRQSSQ